MSRMGISKGLEQNMRIAIIGGGLSGLVSGYRLSPCHNISIYEKSGEIGGLVSSYTREHYSVERYYHHFFSRDTCLLNLLEELNLSNEILWLKGSTGTYQNGNVYPLTTPLEILKYPHLSLCDKFRLALFTKKVNRFHISDLDAISAEKFLIGELGEKIYRSFFRPLLNSKFGQNADEVSAAWLVSRVSIRSDRSIGGERLGYLNRGFSTFIKAISAEISKQGGDIRINTPVTSIFKNEGVWYVNDTPYDLVIGTIAPALLRRAGVTIPDIPYQGAACLTMGLSRSVTNGIYWVNLYDDAPYGAVIEHTCFAPFAWYGEHIVYLASYYTGEIPEGLKERMIEDFCKKFSVQKDEINWAEMTVEPYAGPLYLAGYKEQMKSVSVPGLLLAGMFSEENYPERSLEGSVRAGLRVAREVMEMEHTAEVNV